MGDELFLHFPGSLDFRNQSRHTQTVQSVHERNGVRHTNWLRRPVTTVVNTECALTFGTLVQGCARLRKAFTLVLGDVRVWVMTFMYRLNRSSMGSLVSLTDIGRI